MRSPTTAVPHPTSTSSAGRPKASAAIAASWRLTSRQASATAVPMKTVDRLADVCRSNGAMPVSPMTIWTASTGSPSSSAAICDSTVRAPWPMSDVPASTVALPSMCSRTME